METYGDWGFIAPDFVMPADIKPADYESVIADQEQKIAELLKKLSEVTTAASGTSKKDRVKHAETVSSMMNWTEAQTRCLIDEQLRKAGWEADTQALRYSNTDCIYLERDLTHQLDRYNRNDNITAVNIWAGSLRDANYLIYITYA